MSPPSFPLAVSLLRFLRATLTPSYWLGLLSSSLPPRQIVDTSEVARPDAYIASLFPFSSVLSPSPSPSADGQAASWILSHSDFSLGALYTHPPHRRQGLAHVVVRDRVKGMRQAGVRAWCCVSETNVPSQRFWTSLGWGKGWECGWFRLSVEGL